MKTKRPLIFVTNDDSIKALGIRALIKAVQPYGDIVVVAPEKPMSGKGLSITVESPLRVKPIAEYENVKEYAITGTPVDCVKLGIQKVLERKPDLIVSGINHGSNASVNILYSGTMGAAIEGCILGIPSIGFSLLNYSSNADFSATIPFVRSIIEQTLDKGLPKGVCLNVNIPDESEDDIKGIKFCRQAKGRWSEEFEERLDPRGGKYYWLTGKFIYKDGFSDDDQHALENNYVAAVPVQIDLTAHKELNYFNDWNK
ncbi:MAG: 5'/3'-nucleotidase SurE [Hyphomicrobiales bacterium]